MNNDLLIVFAKSPRGKDVKTRLKTVLTIKARKQLQEAFIRDTLFRIASLPITRVLACTPRISDPFFRQCQRQYGVDLLMQEGRSLGRRMENAFSWGMTQGFKKQVIIGTDSPTLPVSLIQKAFDHLRTIPVVLGPATDGGYYLIGLRTDLTSLPDIFTGIRWGSKTVLTETLKRLSYYSLLPFWYDVDRPEDLDFLKVHLSRGGLQGARADETWKCVKRLCNL